MGLGSSDKGTVRVIAVSYHDSLAVLQEAKPVSAGPFDRTEWFNLFTQHHEKKMVFCVAKQGDTMAALPLQQMDSKRLDALTNWYSFTWRPLLTENAVAAPLFAAMARDLKSRARRIVLAPLPDEDASASLLTKAFREAGWFVHRTPCDTNHTLPVKGRRYADYLASRPGPLRGTIARRKKALSIDIITEFHCDAWDIYQDIYAGSWKPSEGDPRFLKEFAMDEGRAGRLRLGIARHDGAPVAAQFWTVEQGTAYIHKLAHRSESNRLSPGTVLTAALMEHVIDRDHVALVDFGTGHDRYKTDWMEEIRPRFRLDCHNPTHVGSWPHIARAALQRLASGISAG